VLAGAPGWDTAPLLARIDSSPRREHIHRPGYVNRELARALLRHTACFVLASEAEGFGLPLAEAISCGAPSVASAIPSLHEAGGEACLFARVGDADAFAAQIARALRPQVAEELRQAARRQAPKLRWPPVVAAWRRLLESTANR
jgi:glycosyltransferase involved in cell wall biosynthesis